MKKPEWKSGLYKYHVELKNVIAANEMYCVGFVIYSYNGNLEITVDVISEYISNGFLKAYDLTGFAIISNVKYVSGFEIINNKIIFRNVAGNMSGTYDMPISNATISYTKSKIPY